ncbi:hypothetical protein SCUCBS95973_003392 [Sporothrix curviconia]|uniref:DNA-directed RNA polymerase II subunit RPB9-like zinc ribbon domain-containing protein n=1 Tax=Sporothrix curviconia TaxID=1260050 RepID=A0ABP0BEZ4_9PEZI
MSSPQSTTSHEGDNQSKKNLEQITFRFCAECSNMLYPKEDEDSHKLQFTCRTCQYTEEAASTCVFRNVLNNAAGETAGVTQDVGSDPTLFCKPPSSPTTSAISTTTASTMNTTTDNAVFSPTLRDLDDLDLYPDECDFLDVCSDDYGYEFMDGTEYGNSDDI